MDSDSNSYLDEAVSAYFELVSELLRSNNTACSAPQRLIRNDSAHPVATLSECEYSPHGRSNVHLHFAFGIELVGVGL